MTDRETEPKEKSERRSRFAEDGMTNLEAKYAAQRLAFGPMMFQAARVLRISGALEVIKTAGRTGITALELTKQVDHLSVYAARILLEGGLAAEMVALEGERFVLTKVGYLVLRDPMTTVNIDFVHHVCYRAFFHFEEAVMEGTPAGLKELGPWPTIYEGLSDLPEEVQRSWFAFDHFYSDGVFEKVLPIVFQSKPKTLLDVGGNTGKWAIECCQFDSGVRVTILDLPGQLAKALSNAKKQGLANRIDGQEIDFRVASSPIPTGSDVIWMSQFLDCFGEEEIVSILTRAATAMSTSSALYILETYWDRQRYEAARYSVINTSLYFTAVANGNSKMYHSDRIKHCVEAAGLKVDEEHDVLGVSHTLFRCSRG
ncbi:MAG: hypothetical protein ACI8X5_003121 [Planctomycetota bacterium]|jgi:hypothetical protein